MDALLLSPIANSAMSSYEQSPTSQGGGSIKTPKRVLNVVIEDQAPKTPETQKVKEFWSDMMPLTPEGVIDAYRRISPNMNMYNGKITPALYFEGKQPVVTEGASVPVATPKAVPDVATPKAVPNKEEPLTFEKQIEATLKTFTDLQKCLIDAEDRLLFYMDTNFRNLSVCDNEILAAYEILNDVHHQHPLFILAIQDKDEYMDMVYAFHSLVSVNINEYLKVYTRSFCIGIGTLKLNIWKEKAKAFYSMLHSLISGKASGVVVWNNWLFSKSLRATKEFHVLANLLIAIKRKDRRLCKINMNLKIQFSETILF